VSPRALASAAAIGLLASLQGCLTVPAPEGRWCTSAHYEVRTDSEDPRVARSVAQLAETYHKILEEYFATTVGDQLPVVVCLDAHNFAHYRREAAGSSPAIGFFSCHPSYAVVSDHMKRKEQVLAHELVHYFVHEAEPDLPFWMDEGLACELSHDPVENSREPSSEDDVLGTAIFLHGKEVSFLPIKRERERARPPTVASAVEEAAWLSDDEIVEIASSLHLWRDDDPLRYSERSSVAAALMRFGMETQGWRDLGQARGWQPDAWAFLRWLRGGAHTAERFAGIVRD
jgi:hypothetical protein